jgi:RHS repeat-associated protein
MVEQNRSGSYTQILYGPSGSELALLNGQTLKSAFVPLTAGATAVYTASGLSYYRHSDWLGSSRLASTTSGGVYYDGAYAPYGEPYAEIGTPDRSFTGQNQDTVTDPSAGLYDFLFREYRPTFSRWISPDPAGIAAVDPANPQSWNRYAYVGDDPIIETDEYGMCPSGTHAATSEEASQYVQTAMSYVGEGLVHSNSHATLTSNGALSGIDCTGLIMCALSGKNYNAGAFQFSFTFDGLNLTTRNINQWTDPGTGAVGDIIYFSTPGHAGIVLSKNTFVGSQTSTGPAVAQFGPNVYWGNPKKSSSPVFRRPCISNKNKGTYSAPQNSDPNAASRESFFWFSSAGASLGDWLETLLQDWMKHYLVR